MLFRSEYERLRAINSGKGPRTATVTSLLTHFSNSSASLLSSSRPFALVIGAGKSHSPAVWQACP